MLRGHRGPVVIYVYDWFGLSSMHSKIFLNPKVCLLLYVVQFNAAHWVIENPLSSLVSILIFKKNTENIWQCHTCFYFRGWWPKVYLHRRFARVLKTRKHHRICTWLGMFGSKTPKPIRLWSNSPFVEKLKRSGFMQPICVKYIRMPAYDGSIWMSTPTWTPMTVSPCLQEACSLQIQRW